MNLRSSWADALWEQAAGRFDPWLSCDGCFDRSDTVLEDLLDRETPVPDDFRAHLRGCSACRDEMETLAELAAGDRGLDAVAVRAQLDAQIAPA